MKTLRERTEKELNQVLFKKNPERMRGLLDMANLLNEWGGQIRHPYALGDCLLCKFNLLTKRQIRNNPQWKYWKE